MPEIEHVQGRFLEMRRLQLYACYEVMIRKDALVSLVQFPEDTEILKLWQEINQSRLSALRQPPESAVREVLSFGSDCRGGTAPGILPHEARSTVRLHHAGVHTYRLGDGADQPLALSALFGQLRPKRRALRSFRHSRAGSQHPQSGVLETPPDGRRHRTPGFENCPPNRDSRRAEDD
ncbi:MAG: hypothetical protein RLZZ360_632 [Candidatus Parcubacteria bacterium]